MSHVTHVNENYVTHINEACDKYEVVTHMNGSCYTYERVMSHMYMRHVTHVHESCHAYKQNMVPPTRAGRDLQRVTHMNE